MPFRRFSRRGGFRKRSREPVFWDALGQRTSSVGGALGVAVLAVPSGFSAASESIDQRFTVRRIIITCTSWAAQAINNDVDLMCGVYVAEVNATVFRDPRFLSDADERTDWMDLFTLPVTTLVGALQIVPANMDMLKATRDIRVGRKLTRDQQVNLSIAAVIRSSGLAATGTYGLAVHGRSLWSRTMGR